MKSGGGKKAGREVVIKSPQSIFRVIWFDSSILFDMSGEAFPDRNRRVKSSLPHARKLIVKGFVDVLRTSDHYAGNQGEESRSRRPAS